MYTKSSEALVSITRKKHHLLSLKHTHTSLSLSITETVKKMVSPKSKPPESVLCDFCNQQPAVLYCRSDSAKLCLLCDQHVHSANLLSRKHLRSQICENCGSEPVSIQCTTDNLVLCQGCDWDAHGSCSVSATHERSPVEDFSDCPSALELASLWGFDLECLKKAGQPPNPASQNWFGAHDFDILQDLIVPQPKENGVVWGNIDYGEMTMEKEMKCGKQNQVLYMQLVELLKKELMVGGEKNLDPPETLNKSDLNGNAETTSFELKNGIEANGIGLQSGFASLLMMPTHHDQFKQSDDIVDGDIYWSSSNQHNVQVVVFFLFIFFLNNSYIIPS